jgi:hypothetical protein
MLDLKDKVILVSKRMIAEDGSEAQDVYFGRVVAFNENAVKVEKQNGGNETLPYIEDAYEPAQEGFYELEDGSVYDNPDYIAEFVRYEDEAAFDKHGHLNT